MPYSSLIVAYDKLPVLARSFDVVHLAPPPATISRLKKGGLGRIASHSSLASKIVGKPTRKRADRVADTPFSYGPSCRPGRYSNGFPALYTAHDLSVAVEELKYHLIKNGALAGGLKPRYVVLRASAYGKFRNLSTLPNRWHPQLVLDTDYRPTQALGTAAVSKPLDFLVVPSARHSMGFNSPVFFRSAIIAKDIKQKGHFRIDSSGAAIFVSRP